MIPSWFLLAVVFVVAGMTGSLITLAVVRRQLTRWVDGFRTTNEGGRNA